MTDTVGELLVSLILVICCSPTLLPSTWRGSTPADRWGVVIGLVLLVLGILGTGHALLHLT